MRQPPSTTPTRNYSGVFLAAVLPGIVVVVLGLTMVEVHPASPACCVVPQYQER
jgi:hypothetical protein